MVQGSPDARVPEPWLLMGPSLVGTAIETVGPAFELLGLGGLEISPHFDLWRHFFAINLSKKRVGKQELSMPMGCASIHLRNKRANNYPLMRLSTSNKGWHS